MRRVEVPLWHLVAMTVLAGIFGAVLAGNFDPPARAGVVDDATAIRHSVEHLDRVQTEAFHRLYGFTP